MATVQAGGHLSNADAVDPLVQSSHIITAKVLDILGFLLDLRVLQKNC